MSGAHFDAQGLAEEAFEFRRVTRRGPEFQFGIAGGTKLQESVIAPIVDLQS